VGDLFTRLTRFFDLSKTVAVTVPGLVAAAALTVLARPAHTEDYIAVLRSNAACEFDQTALQRPQEFSLASYHDSAIKNQILLEKSRRHLQDSIMLRTSELGAEEAAIADLNHDIALLTKERDAFEKKYLNYVESLGPLRDSYKRDFDKTQREIAGKRPTLLKAQLDAKRRQLDIDRFKASLKTVDERLGDPGRLRPAATLEAYLDGLTTKVLAFGLLAMVLGYTLDPINRGIFSFLFDYLLLWIWNQLRVQRFTVVR
jgi:hypothetical protein